MTDREAEEEETGVDGQAAALLRLAVQSGFLLSQVSGTLARVGAVDAFDGRARSAEELARDTGTHAPSLRRLLRAACAVGLVTADGGGRFSLTSFGAEFRGGSPARMGADLYGTPALWGAFGALEDAVRTGVPAFEGLHGTGFYESFTEDEVLGERFSTAMALTTAVSAPVIVGSYDFGGFGHIVDVGGGDGTLLAAVLAAHRTPRGTLYDRAEALRAAPDTLSATGTADRCALTEGDFLTAVPDGADAYLLRNILHGLDDERCVRVLDNCRRAGGPDTTVLVVTQLMPDETEIGQDADAFPMVLSDIETLVLTPGRERTLAEHEDLLERADLKPAGVTALPGLPYHALLEALPSA